jgi:hypothetical protein
MANYQEQIAQLRQQRAIAEHQAQAEELVATYQESMELREEAAQRGDAAAWHIHDSACETLEHDWDRYYRPRPQQQPVDPRMAGYFKRKKTFLDRHGNAAANAMDMAHQYATRPRTGSANPGNTGMGLQAGTPQYFKAMDDLLEMYAGNFGLKYDPKEDTVGPNEAARISNVSPNGYNQGVRQMWQAGRNSGAEYAQQWGKKVG